MRVLTTALAVEEWAPAQGRGDDQFEETARVDNRATSPSPSCPPWHSASPLSQWSHVVAEHVEGNVAGVADHVSGHAAFRRRGYAAIQQHSEQGRPARAAPRDRR